MKKQANIRLRHILPLVLLLVCSQAASAALTGGQEYYLWLNIYEKLLGTNEGGTAPALSAYGTRSEADSYVFVAEPSGKSGYVLLRQKSSGKYLAASSTSSWSIVFEDGRSTDDRFCWAADEGCYTYLTNKKNGKYLGIDGANKGSTYVTAYYDKPKGSHSQFTVIPTGGGTWDEARQAYASAEYTNAQGIREKDYCLLKDLQVDRSDNIDIHLTANDTPLQGTARVNLGSDRTWLIIDNVVPSTVTSTYLKHVTIGGQAAKNGSNCRVAIYLNGAAVIPLPPAAMTCQGTSGEFTLTSGNHADLQARSNTMTSFTLRRGYMATLATATGGKGYSRVFVADHADLTVELPRALSRRVTSVNIKPWQYLSKKGWGNAGGTSGGPQLRATWYWSWNAAYNSTADMEFVPCRQHRYWPSASEVNSHTSTAAMSINEPEHAEQHTSNKCSCGGTIDEWTCYTINPDFLPGGGRIGSPQPTETGFLTNFCNYVDNMQSRCDFTVTHAYWDLASYDETSYANWFCNTKCKAIWNNTGRPVWLSEMEISASWNGTKVTSYEQNRKYLQALLQKIDDSPWIERYAIYGTDMWQTYMFYDANPSHGLTPAGQVYRDHRATFAYNAQYTKVPTFWAPGIKAPTLAYSVSAAEGSVTFTLGNTNGDCTDSLTLQRKRGDGPWEDLYTVEDRQALENSTVKYALPIDEVDFTNDQFRVSTTNLFGSSALSQESQASFLANPDCTNGSTGWTVSTLSTNTGQAWDGVATNTYWNQWKSGSLTSSMTQTVADLPEGDYQLSALLRCTAGLTATLTATVTPANGTATTYSATVAGTGDQTAEGSNYQYGWQLATTPTFTLQAGDRLTVTASFSAQQTAWWSADHFQLIRLPKEEDPQPATPEDLDGDGHFTLKDIKELIQHYLGRPKPGQ